MSNFLPNFSDWERPQMQIPIVGSLILAALVDCAITASLTWSLHKSKTGLPTADDLVTRLIRCESSVLTIQTGMITAVVAVIDLILYLSSTIGGVSSIQVQVTTGVAEAFEMIQPPVKLVPGDWSDASTSATKHTETNIEDTPRGQYEIQWSRRS
ncbi:hypothetical protein JAAARDRAFT_197906 [Jaapia argillacea MUCL 33604]|uniref:DUF6534 domain-containing protein n=1 Tax=Jaapia argillacea MUCL 33604 TaxID=933084 RepID=A0A067PD42_9AGAM|nr:hypothetical protein JAAARDRAFT_197906 [Jaapia argillacea MUCL 33604]